jgi:hypothetical protein
MKTGNLSIELKSKAEIELFFFQIELNFFFYFYCVANSIRLGHERKINEENSRNNHELRGIQFFRKIIN